MRVIPDAQALIMAVVAAHLCRSRFTHGEQQGILTGGAAGIGSRSDFDARLWFARNGKR